MKLNRHLKKKMKKFKFLEFKHKEDWGHDVYLTFLKGRHFSFLQLSLGWTDYPAYPHLQVSSGCGRLFSLIFWCYKFAIDFEILGHTWRI